MRLGDVVENGLSMMNAEKKHGGWMRVAVFVIGGLEAVAMLFIIWLGVQGLNSSEQLSRSISQALVVSYGIPFLVVVLPSLVLAALNRWLPFALGLCTLGALAAWGVIMVVLR